MTPFGRDRRDRELSEEIDTHLALAEEEYRRRGLSATDARDAARRAFGGVLKTRQVYREQGAWRWLDALRLDARVGLRTLVRDRGFALTAILVLGLGIGVNNMMFTLLYGSALRGLPIASADRVLHISTFDKRFPDRPLSYQEFNELRSEARSFAGLAAFTSTALSVGDEGRAPDRYEGAYTTAGTFEIIGIAPLIGRTFSADEDRVGAEPVVLLSRRAWESRYGPDPNVVGRSVFVDGIAATVIGVMPDGSGFPGTAEVWLPLAQAPSAAQELDSRTLRVIGRLREGVTADDARLEVESIVAAIARQRSDVDGLAARVVPIDQRFFGGLGHPAWLPFITASILVVLVSSANAANLVIGRSILRAREFAIRGSLGATRARMIGQFLVEALALAALGGGLGGIISFGAARIFESAIPEQTLPYWLHYGMDWRILAALIAVALGTVLLFGLIPAIQASKLDVNSTLRAGGRPGLAPSGTRRLTSTFLIAQFALSVVLLAQVVVSFQEQGPLVESDRAVDTPSLLAASITLPTGKYPTPSTRLALYERIGEVLERAPGVSAVTIASHLPRGGGREQRLEIDGRPPGNTEPAPTVHTVTVGPGYFAVLGVPMRQGREFAARDGQPGAAHAVVNARFAQMFFADGDAIGRLIRVSSSNAPTSDAPWLSVVGVASDVRQRNLPAMDPVVYVPLAAGPLPTSSLIVRSNLEPAAAARLVRDEAARIDPHLPLYRVMTMSQALEDARWNGRASHNLILTITVVALTLSLIGLYAVTAHAVAQRSQEIGIRVALGARPGQVRRLILSRAFTHVVLGAVAGLLGAMAWDATFLSGRAGLLLVSAQVLGPVVLLLAGLTVSACLVPLRRATRLDPVATLRQD